jgi:exosortase/archaeosortase family protein
MAVLDIKVSKKRLFLVLAIGFIGVFLIDLARLGSIFLAFYYFGTAAGETMHTYLGYSLFIAWVLVYWSVSFKYLIPHPVQTSGLISPTKLGPTVK